MARGKSTVFTLPYLKNVITGRNRHWNTEHIPVLKLLVQRTGELEPAERSILISIVSAANLIIGLLLGPDAGRSRILRADARKLTQRDFFSIYFDVVAALLSIFVQRGRLAKVDRAALESSFAHLFHHNPGNDEFYCVFTERLAYGGTSQAFLYLFDTIREIAGEPSSGDVGQWTTFVKAMDSGIESMLELILINTEKSRPLERR